MLFTARVIFNGTDDESGTTVVALEVDDTVTLESTNYEFVQTTDAVEKCVAIHRWGGIIIPDGVTAFKLGGRNVNTGVYDESTVSIDELYTGNTVTIGQSE